MIIRIFAVPAVALALIGCSSAADQTSDEAGTMVARSDGNDLAIDNNGEARYPDGFTPYPGSEAGMDMSGPGQDSGGGGSISFTATGTPGEIIDHFKAEAEAHGMTVNVTDIGSTRKSMTGQGGDGPVDRITVMASENSDGTGSQGRFGYSGADLEF